ncbi:hypothetical protein SAMN02787079_01019 [Lysinibacillus sp. TC-37]|nr:hypothetical protein SAMN02787078_00753 [Lysinibacillus sp. SG9]SDB13304.1 hypothetical protein SAMN02787079_01019 [Lysinibacillus sp. TC-37]SFS51590.1 hypothetical protein SAMN02787087_01022 [Lysinibacillus sp. SG55]
MELHREDHKIGLGNACDKKQKRKATNDFIKLEDLLKIAKEIPSYFPYLAIQMRFTILLLFAFQLFMANQFINTSTF